MLRLWGFRNSTNADRIVMALEFKGIRYEEVPIDPADRSPMIELTGQPLVPAIELDGQVVWDSPRILGHLEERFPDPALYPRDPTARAEAQVFVDWFNRVWKVAPNRLTDEGPDAELEAEMDRHQALLDALLADGREYLLGEFGIADVTAWPFLRYAVDRDPDDDEPFHQTLRARMSLDGRPDLGAWIDRVAARSGSRSRFGLA